jgi:bifunctional non-homologous end joining protein LigD
MGRERSMKPPLSALPSDVTERLKQIQQPDWVEPMLATLTDRRFSDDRWIFERKLDGERCLAYLSDGGVRLMSRNRKELNVHYPELVSLLSDTKRESLIVDGEIVAFQGRVTSFSRLQERMHVEDAEEARQSKVNVYYYLFDVLYLDGYDTREVSLRHRKSLLKEAFSFRDPLRFMQHRNREGQDYFERACQKGWEGIIAKDATAPYVGGRSKKWLKFKCVNRQELVIGGYTDPHGERVGFGALLLGYYDGDDLVYAGKVGTGFDDETLRRLKERMSALERDTPPFAENDLPSKEVHWVKPELVAQIGFEEWTASGKLRQPRFEGLREDKDAADVVKEEPSP